MSAFARSSSAALALAALAVTAGAPRVLAGETQLSLAPAPSAVTDPRVDEQSKMPPISIRVAVATAFEAEGDVDPKARDIYEHLPNRFHSIELLSEKTISVYFGERATVDLPNGNTVLLLPVAVHHGQLHLQLEMPDVLNTSMRMSNSRAFYVGGVDYGKGTLIFKLVPEFGAYVDAPAAEHAAPPQTQPARGNR
jgi:hypothetical protein